MRTARGGAAGAKIQHHLRSAYGYNSPSEPPSHHVRSYPDSGLPSANVRNLVIFVRTTPRCGSARDRRRPGSYDPTRTLAEQSFTLFMRTMPRGVRHGRDRLRVQYYDHLGRLLDSFTLRA